MDPPYVGIMKMSSIRGAAEKRYFAENHLLASFPGGTCMRADERLRSDLRDGMNLYLFFHRQNGKCQEILYNTLSVRTN